METLEATLTAFYDDVARHLRPWQAESDAGEGRRIVRRGEINGRSFLVFEDGSIEIDTGTGIKRFNSLADLSAAAKNGHADTPAETEEADVEETATEAGEQSEQHS